MIFVWVSGSEVTAAGQGSARSGLCCDHSVYWAPESLAASARRIILDCTAWKIENRILLLPKRIWLLGFRLWGRSGNWEVDLG